MKKKYIKIIPIFISLLLGITLTNCDSSKLRETPIENFIGVWELQGRSTFEGLKIEIYKNEKNILVGKVISTNDNKYVKMFIEVDDVWITSIKRRSNYEFSINEKKIASELFSLYGLNSNSEFKVQFIDKNTIGLAEGSSNPITSTIIYKREIECLPKQ